MKNGNLFILKYLAVVLVLFVFSCKQKEDTNKEASFQEKRAALFSEKMDIKSFKEINLLPEAEKATIEWPEYITAKTEIEKIPDYTLQEVVSNSNNLLQTVTSMQDSIPEKFNVVPVKSRLNVLFTKANVLQQLAERQQPVAAEIEKTGIALYKAFGDLEIQLNEVFLKSVEDFENEIGESQKKTALKPQINNRFQSKIKQRDTLSLQKKVLKKPVK